MRNTITLNLRLFGLQSLLLLGTLAVSCTHDPKLINELDAVCYTSEVLPILQGSCGTSGCHSSPGNETSFATNSYQAIMTVVSPGDARGSKLYKVITAIYGENAMPPDQPLTKQQRNTIMVWIEQGAQNVDCSMDTTLSPPEPPITDNVCFTQDIQPLLLSSCATTGCHDAATAKEGIRLTSYGAIISSEEALVPFNPNKSKIYKVLSEDGDDRMPPSPNAPLTTEQIEQIRTWIADGALNNSCPDATCDTTSAISFSSTIFPAINKSCVGCHNSNTTNGGINLSNYVTISDVASTMVDGQSLLLGVVKKQSGFIPMPPSGKLNECSIRQLELWIEQGQQNN